MSFAPFVLAVLLRFPVFFGGGETIAHLEDLPEARRAEFVSAGFAQPAIGLKYEYFSMFLFDLWTGGGEVVVFDEASGDRYLPLTEQQILGITGGTSEALGKPILYRVPLGWIVIVAVVGFYVAKMVRDARALG